jgi:cytochrome c5
MLLGFRETAAEQVKEAPSSPSSDAVAPALAQLAPECKGCPGTFCKGCHESEQKSGLPGPRSRVIGRDRKTLVYAD